MGTENSESFKKTSAMSQGHAIKAVNGEILKAQIPGCGRKS